MDDEQLFRADDLHTRLTQMLYAEDALEVRIEVVARLFGEVAADAALMDGRNIDDEVVSRKNSYAAARYQAGMRLAGLDPDADRGTLSGFIFALQNGCTDLPKE